MHEIEVTIPNDVGHLAGTLTLPERDAPFAAMLLVCGSTPQTRDGNMDNAHTDWHPTPVPPRNLFNTLARIFASEGIASLRYDKRGCGQSSGDFNRTSLLDLVADAKRCLAALRARPEIRAARVGILGQSEGSVISLVIAAEDHDLACVVLQGCPIKNLREIFAWQARVTREHVEAMAPEERERFKKSDPFTYWSDLQFDETVAALERGDEVFWIGDQDWKLPYYLPWLRQHFENPPGKFAPSVASPTLILQGEFDRNVPVDDARRLADAIRSGGKAEVTLKVFEGLEHSFRKVDRIRIKDNDLMRQPAEPIYYDTLKAWLVDCLR